MRIWLNNIGTVKKKRNKKKNNKKPLKDCEEKCEYYNKENKLRLH